MTDTPKPEAGADLAFEAAMFAKMRPYHDMSEREWRKRFPKDFFRLASDFAAALSPALEGREGWRLAPTKPTTTMMRAFWRAHFSDQLFDSAECYAAMLDAAPTPQPDRTEQFAENANCSPTDAKCFECETDLIGPLCPACNPVQPARADWHRF